MTPNELQNNAAALMMLYSDAEQIMLEKVARRLARGIDQRGWAEKKLEEIQLMRDTMVEELSRLERDSKNMRDGYIVTAYGGVVKDFEFENRQYLTKTGITPEARMNAINRLIQEQDVRFNTLNSAILRDTQDEYRSIIGKVVAMQATGVITTQEALRKALNDFADRGITGFTDKAGRKWEMDSYAEMAIRTGMMNARVEAYKDEMKAHDEHLVIISDHQDTCPLCAEYERAILSVDGQDLDDPECDGLLDDAVAGGLFHPNCGHSMTVYVKGLTDKSSGKSRQGYTKEQDEQGYKDRQLQRSLERHVRFWKRREAVAKGDGDAHGERECRNRVEIYHAKLRSLINKTGLPRKYGREGGRVTLSDAAKKLPRTVPQIALEKNARGVNLHNVVDGKDISATWTRRADKFQFEIQDVINAQGFDGLPRIVSKEEFDKAVKAANDGNGFIAQRTYSAPTQEILDEYRNQLYKGEWYVDCSTGGAQYGQGMYCAADYNGVLTDGIKAEMQHYQSQYIRAQATLSYIETLTLDKSAKFITYENAYRLATEWKKEYGKKLILAGDPNDMLASVINMDVGAIVAMHGYDAINAVGHGQSGSYTVILNRTKVIILKED